MKITIDLKKKKKISTTFLSHTGISILVRLYIQSSRHMQLSAEVNKYTHKQTLPLIIMCNTATSVGQFYSNRTIH